MVLTTERPVRRSRIPWVNCATPDAIQHFSWGIGDDNPLWSNHDYACRSRWGGVIAPPCFLYAVDETTVTQGYPDRRRVYRSVDWTFHDVVPAAAAIEAKAALIDESSTDDGIDQLGRVEFRAADGGLLASAVARCTRPQGAAAAIEDRPELRYTGDELNEIERAVLSGERRGSDLREYESTSPGEEFGPLIKGPLSIMDVVAWCAATTGVVPQEAGHSEGGLHDQCATGPQQVTWMSQLVTDWMGDDAFLHRLQVEIFGRPPLGSTTTISGRVSLVTLQDHRPTATIELSAVDQHGVLTASGVAEVIQPSAVHGPVRLPIMP
ncbi:MAG: hypothetical protein O7B25_03615 [Gammaproteobacteria bacterium]|nr:hypothetical protein [Gammaproteobacteria bacterium]